MAKLGKRTAAAREAFAGKSNLSVEEAVALVKGNANAKFDETVEIAVVLGVDPRHADQMVRGVVGLPNGTGKDVRVAVFARGPKAEEAQAAGADIVGAEDLMETVQGGTIDFDRCIATPDMMPVVGRLGKVLGPRNLMPNPKVGTVTMDVAEAVKNAKGGEVQFKVEKAGVVHAGVGKASFDEAKLVENVKAFLSAVAKAKPAGAKGAYMKKINLSSTMGPGVSVDMAGPPTLAPSCPRRRVGSDLNNSFLRWETRRDVQTARARCGRSKARDPEMDPNAPRTLSQQRKWPRTSPRRTKSSKSLAVQWARTLWTAPV